MDELQAAIECLLFVTEKPLTLEALREVLPAVDSRTLRGALEALAVEYEARGGGFSLREVAGGYQLHTRPQFADIVRRLRQSSPQRLSRAALETLAIVAYQQPVIRAEIERIRGVDCGGVLRALLESRIIRVIGRKEIPGRPLIYGTTRHFLEMFDLKDLKDLPTPKEIETMARAGIAPGQGGPSPVHDAGDDPASQKTLDAEGGELV
jgi:segregation and condensation protein B